LRRSSSGGILVRAAGCDRLGRRRFIALERVVVGAAGIVADFLDLLAIGGGGGMLLLVAS
jgi:hypothetical protein